ncbi:PD-(D/E)XK nuclease-like domain-containing protein [Pseudohoeflea coraliihabitans]|uniref:PD-(D/E)XK nuclease-like domain-containing protein n=1 Tax=Pseudohoeflea coraliihabitans TaxID=2860393 RepID=A0ABS6WN64_9HYPH|nr:PD-(D/E)XK nuclease-like domain-containing protein [Pseudohoeflea sp. DP4N28-3]MBW3096852.1 PD-(D/E)XK nuclease-like domain-containing protein [Pseudohoeflea sp. DP4N28-3]
MNIDIDKDHFQSVGAIAEGIVDRFRTERAWDGNPITEPGIYSGISLDEYHHNRSLLDAPSVSKSSLKWIFPHRGGSPKAFWGRWSYNPDCIPQKTTGALDFGRAAHSLMLGDEDFSQAFEIRPAQYKDYKSGAAREWRDKVYAEGKSPLTAEEYSLIEKMALDASKNPVVKAGLLNGRIERSMFAKDEASGIWLRSRPDAIAADGIFADLKTTASLSEDFLEREAYRNGYFLQAAITRMVCRMTGHPFDTFALVYTLKDEVPDTAHVEIDPFEIDRAEKEVSWALAKIRECLDSGEWPGSQPFNDGTRRMQAKPWEKEQVDDFLRREEAA